MFAYKTTSGSESERALLPSVFAHTRNLSWCQELPVQKQYSTNRQQCKQRQHIIKVKIYKLKYTERKMSIDRTVNVHVLCTDEGLSYLQMYSTGVCYVLFRWDTAWGKKKQFLCLAVFVLSDL